MREKSFYTAPNLEVLHFLLNEDVITTSDSSSSSNSENHGTWTDDYPVTPVPGK